MTVGELQQVLAQLPPTMSIYLAQHPECPAQDFYLLAGADIQFEYINKLETVECLTLWPFPPKVNK